MSPEPGYFETRDKDLAGRIGRLYTPHGWLETPALLPVIDAARQELPVEEIEKIGFKAVITNAYLLKKRLGNVERSVHEILGFNGIVMTDSGAYQILEYGDIDATQEEIIEFEKRLGSDIAVILDIPTGNARDYEAAKHSVEETLRRARRALSLVDPDKRVWTLPLQGGTFIDLLARSAREATQLLGPYRLLALGSPTVLLERYDYASLVEMIYTARSNTPWSVPMHLFGAGHPMIIPFAVALGIDMFDSASYILYARDNRIMTETRTYRLEDLEEMPCTCPVCTKYSPRELLEMPKRERVKLLAAHNLYVLQKTLRETRQAIREGRLWELLEERSRSHPSLARAFAKLAKYRDYLEKHTPRVKAAAVKGLFLLSPESASHPRLIQHNKMLLARYKPPTRKALLIPQLEDEKPLTRSKIYRRHRGTDAHIIGYSLYIGPVPWELAETYPLSQYEANTTPYTEAVKETIERITEYLIRHSYREATIIACRDKEWTTRLAKALAETLPSRGIRTELREEECRDK